MAERPKPVANDSMCAFSHGLPGSMKSVFTPDSSSQFFTAVETNSGPLSDRMNSGSPCTWNRYARTSTTSSPVMLRSTSSAKLSLVCSSSTGMNFNCRPSSVRSNTKS